MPQKTNKNPFDYMFRDNPKVLAELTKLGIKFIAVGDEEGSDPWPALVLPSGSMLHIASDDEGNGPGAIHITEWFK